MFSRLAKYLALIFILAWSANVSASQVTVDDNPFVDGPLDFAFLESGVPIILYAEDSESRDATNHLIIATCKDQSCKNGFHREKVAPIGGYDQPGLYPARLSAIRLLIRQDSTAMIMAKWRDDTKKNTVLIHCKNVTCSDSEIHSTAIDKERGNKRRDRQVKLEDIHFSRKSDSLVFFEKLDARSRTRSMECDLDGFCKNNREIMSIEPGTHPLFFLDMARQQIVVGRSRNFYSSILTCETQDCRRFNINRLNFSAIDQPIKALSQGYDLTYVNTKSNNVMYKDCTSQCSPNDFVRTALENAEIEDYAITDNMTVLVYADLASAERGGFGSTVGVEKRIAACGSPQCSNLMVDVKSDGTYGTKTRHEPQVAAGPDNGVGIAFGGDGLGVFYKFCRSAQCFESR